MRAPGVWVVVVVAAAVAAAAGARADLPVGDHRRCGDIFCSQDEYCHSFDKHCRPCREICVAGTNNFDAVMCQQDCQAFIHDQRYVSRNEDVIESLNKRVQTLTVLSTVALVLAVGVMLFCLGHSARFARGRFRSLWRLTKDKAKTGAGRDEDEESAKGAEARKEAPAALKLDVRALPGAAAAGAGAGPQASRGPESTPPPALSRTVSQEPVTPATTSTPLSRPRHPSEDNTLEYAAYDNPGLLPPSPPPRAEIPPPISVTPSPNTRKESSF